MTKTFAERCKMFEQCLPDATYRDLLRALHKEMLAKLAEQPAQEPVAWVDGATHYQPHQKAFYKRVSATEWYVWSRIEQEPLHWRESLGTSDSGSWILRYPAQQEPVAWIWKYANGEEEVVFVSPRHICATHVDAPSTITPLYTTPQAQPAREWVDLTDEDFQWVYDHGRTPAGMMEMVEAKLKEKNHE